MGVWGSMLAVIATPIDMLSYYVFTLRRYFSSEPSVRVEHHALEMCLEFMLLSILLLILLRVIIKYVPIRQRLRQLRSVLDSTSKALRNLIGQSENLAVAAMDRDRHLNQDLRVRPSTFQTVQMKRANSQRQLFGSSDLRPPTLPQILHLNPNFNCREQPGSGSSSESVSPFQIRRSTLFRNRSDTHLCEHFRQSLEKVEQKLSQSSLISISNPLSGTESVTKEKLSSCNLPDLGNSETNIEILQNNIIQNGDNRPNDSGKEQASSKPMDNKTDFLENKCVANTIIQIEEMTTIDERSIDISYHTPRTFIKQKSISQQIPNYNYNSSISMDNSPDNNHNYISKSRHVQISENISILSDFKTICDGETQPNPGTRHSHKRTNECSTYDITADSSPRNMLKNQQKEIHMQDDGKILNNNYQNLDNKPIHADKRPIHTNKIPATPDNRQINRHKYQLGRDKKLIQNNQQNQADNKAIHADKRPIHTNTISKSPDNRPINNHKQKPGLENRSSNNKHSPDNRTIQRPKNQQNSNNRPLNNPTKNSHNLAGTSSNAVQDSKCAKGKTNYSAVKIHDASIRKTENSEQKIVKKVNAIAPPHQKEESPYLTPWTRRDTCQSTGLKTSKRNHSADSSHLPFSEIIIKPNVYFDLSGEDLPTKFSPRQLENELPQMNTKQMNTKQMNTKQMKPRATRSGTFITVAPSIPSPKCVLVRHLTNLKLASEAKLQSLSPEKDVDKIPKQAITKSSFSVKDGAEEKEKTKKLQPKQKLNTNSHSVKRSFVSNKASNSKTINSNEIPANETDAPKREQLVKTTKVIANRSEKNIRKNTTIKPKTVAPQPEECKVVPVQKNTSEAIKRNEQKSSPTVTDSSSLKNKSMLSGNKPTMKSKRKRSPSVNRKKALDEFLAKLDAVDSVTAFTSKPKLAEDDSPQQIPVPQNAKEDQGKVNVKKSASARQKKNLK